MSCLQFLIDTVWCQPLINSAIFSSQINNTLNTFFIAICLLSARCNFKNVCPEWGMIKQINRWSSELFTRVLSDDMSHCSCQLSSGERWTISSKLSPNCCFTCLLTNDFYSNISSDTDDLLIRPRLTILLFSSHIFTKQITNTDLKSNVELCFSFLSFTTINSLRYN